MTFLFIGLFLSLFAWLAWKKLEQAVMLLVLLLPAYVIRFQVIIPSTLLEAMIVIVFLVWLYQNRTFLKEQWRKLLQGKHLNNQPYPFRWPIIAWLIISFIAVGVSGFNLAAFGLWRAYFFEPLLLFIVIINVFNTKEKLICLLGPIGISVSLVSLVAWYQYFTGQFIPNDFWAGTVNRRATSIFPYPNAVGLYLGPLIIVLLGHLSWLFRAQKKWQTYRWQYISSGSGIVLGMGAIIMARSEGALLATLLVAIVFGLLARKKIRLITVSIMIIGALVVTNIRPLATYVSDRFLLRDFSGQVRRAQWQETWQMLSDGRLISGAGLGSYQAAIAPYHQEGIFVKDYHDPDFQRKVVFNEQFRNSVWQPLEIYLYPHNVILNFWSELGIGGVIVFLWLVITFFYYGFKAFQKAVQTKDPFVLIILGLSLSLLVSLVHGIVDVPYFKNDLAAWFFVSFGMMGVLTVLYNVKKEP